jgi:hypothetical protein
MARHIDAPTHPTHASTHRAIHADLTGKMNRGLSVLNTFQHLIAGREPTPEVRALGLLSKPHSHRSSAALSRPPPSWLFRFRLLLSPSFWIFGSTSTRICTPSVRRSGRARHARHTCPNYRLAPFSPCAGGSAGSVGRPGAGVVHRMAPGILPCLGRYHGRLYHSAGTAVLVQGQGTPMQRLGGGECTDDRAMLCAFHSILPRYCYMRRATLADDARWLLLLNG